MLDKNSFLRFGGVRGGDAERSGAAISHPVNSRVIAKREHGNFYSKDSLPSADSVFAAVYLAFCQNL